MFILFILLLFIHPISPQEVNPHNNSTGLLLNNYLTNTTFLDEPVSKYRGIWTNKDSRLFLESPKMSDVQQSILFGDCYLMSALLSVAYNDPSLIKRNIIPVGGGNYYVNLFYRGELVTIPVDDRYLYTNYPYSDYSSSYNALASPVYDENGTAIIWPMLYEKAFAKLNTASHLVDPQDGYDGIDWGGWDQGLTAITGKPSVTIEREKYQSINALPYLNKFGKHEIVGFTMFLYPDELATFPGYRNNSIYCNDGSIVSRTGLQGTLGSKGLLVTTIKGEKIVFLGYHTYSVVDYKEGTVTLVNPWGFNYDQIGRRIGSTIKISDTALQCATSYIVYVESTNLANSALTTSTTNYSFYLILIIFVLWK